MDQLIYQMLGGGLLGTTANSIISFTSWLGKCMSGSCGTTPAEVTEILTGIGPGLPQASGFIGNLISKPLTLVLNFLPDGGGFPTVFHTSAQYFGNMLASVNWLLPVDTLIYCVTFVFGLVLMLWGFHVMRVFVSFIRGIPVDRFGNLKF